MTTPRYPADLPNPMRLTLGPTDQLATSDLEGSGVAVRRRTQVPGASASVTWRYLDHEYLTFVNWWRAELLHGRRWFQLPIPSAGGVTWHTSRFAVAPKARAHGHEYWEVEATLEVRERRFKPVTEGDPHWASVRLLLNASGGLYKDSSSFDRAIVHNTAWGNDSSPRVTTAVTLFGGAVYEHVSGEGTLRLLDDTFMLFGSEEWCVELFVRPTATIGDGRFLSLSRYEMGRQPDGRVYALCSNIDFGSYFVSSASGEKAPLNEWSHIAFVRDKSDQYWDYLKLYVRGKLAAQSGSVSKTGVVYGVNGAGWIVGNYTFGQFAQVRVTAGTARYYADFAPPTAAFPTE